MDHRDFIVRNPTITRELPMLKGTPVPLRTLLASLAEGATIGEILEDYPTLTDEHVRAAIAFAAMSALDDLALPECRI